MSTFTALTESQAAWCRETAALLATDSLADTMARSFTGCPTATRDRVAALAPTLSAWIADGMAAAALARMAPVFVDREVSLAEAVEAFTRPVLPGEWRLVPVSTIGNEPVPGLMTELQNLQFRFLHDWLHAKTAADATFEGELCLTLAHQCCAPIELWPLFASEVAGQAAVAITTGAFPEQKLALSCWNVLWLEMADKLLPRPAGWATVTA